MDEREEGDGSFVPICREMGLLSGLVFFVSFWDGLLNIWAGVHRCTVGGRGSRRLISSEPSGDRSQEGVSFSFYEN